MYNNYVQLLNQNPTFDKFESQRKLLTMDCVNERFDMFQFKIYQVLFHLMPENHNYTSILKEMAAMNFFYKLDSEQRALHARFVKSICEKENVNITIENDEDFGSPPEFIYLAENEVTAAINKDQSPENGKVTLECECNDCNKDSNCCPKKKKTNFCYKRNQSGSEILRPIERIMIVECGASCKCGPDCLNRVTQRPSKARLCLFKTEDRGWGILAKEAIPSGTFLFSYTGEMMNQEVAKERAELDFAYFFDFKPKDEKSDFYTIDSKYKGNLSRFVNHSCNPNCIIWTTRAEPEKQKLW